MPFDILSTGLTIKQGLLLGDCGMKGESQLITLPVAAVIGTLIMVGMPIVARMQPKPPDDPWLKLRPPTAEAGGRILHDGQPIKGAVVCFTSTFEDPHRTYSAIGVTNSDGRFLLNAFRGTIGAPLGPQTVSIQYMVPTGRVFKDPMFENDPYFGEDPGIPEMASGIPRRYSDAETSGLTATITAEGPNDFLFELVGPGEPPDPHDNPYAPYGMFREEGLGGFPPAAGFAPQAAPATGPSAAGGNDASREGQSADEQDHGGFPDVPTREFEET